MSQYQKLMQQAAQQESLARTQTDPDLCLTLLNGAVLMRNAAHLLLSFTD